MPDQTTAALDLSLVDDPNVRRTLRSMHEQFSAALLRQEREIEALLDLLIEKRVTSVGEVRLRLQRLAQGDRRAERIHEQMTSAHTPHEPPRKP